MHITDASHLDHALLPAHIAFLAERFAARDAFFIETIELPAHLPDLPCGLWGPIMGDAPVPDAEVTLRHRGERSGPSRMVARAPRPSRLVTVVAGPHAAAPCVLYTAYGGPPSPREPWELGLTPEQAAESRAFWNEHALSFG